MRPFRLAVLALGLAAFLAAPYVSGADDEKPRRGKLQGRFGDFRPSLLPRGSEEKLNLTAEQKEKLAKLQKEFDEKYKDKFGKIRDDLRKAFESRDREAIRKAMEKMREVSEAAGKLRDEYQTKVEALLTDAQKKQLAGLNKDRPPFGKGPGRGRDFGRPPPAPGLSPRALDQLKLTDEQKEKIAKLRKDLQEKIKGMLTEEQRKKLEEIEKERPRGREGPPRRGGKGV